MITTMLEVGTAAVVAVILEKILIAFNKIELAEWVRIAGVSLIGVVVVAQVAALLWELAKFA